MHKGGNTPVSPHSEVGTALIACVPWCGSPGCPGMQISQSLAASHGQGWGGGQRAHIPFISVAGVVLGAAA